MGVNRGVLLRLLIQQQLLLCLRKVELGELWPLASEANSSSGFGKG